MPTDPAEPHIIVHLCTAVWTEHGTSPFRARGSRRGILWDLLFSIATEQLRWADTHETVPFVSDGSMNGERRERKARDVSEGARPSEGGATERHLNVSPAVAPTTKNGRPEDRPPTHMPTAPRALRNLWIQPLRIDRLPGKCDIPNNINGAQELMPYSQLNEK